MTGLLDRNIACFGALLLVTCVIGTEASAYTTIDECAPTLGELPLTYYLADDGTEQFSNFEELEEIFEDSFATWQNPCCAEFSAEYGGSISRADALDASQTDSVLVFHDEEWPAEYGGPDTIAVTLSLVEPGCELANAPVHFNSKYHLFIDAKQHDEPPDHAVDLQSIATHEIGHLLGLGHSEFLEATMFAAYVGGTSPRELHDDDIDGVCSLYPEDCPCTDDEPCRSDEVCDGGLCVPDPCTDDEDCDQGSFICLDGTCGYPVCDEDDDCGGERICENNRCVEPCPACRPCTEHADCGHQGYCRSFPHGGRCFISCGQDSRCPGDTECTEVPFGDRSFSFCTAPDPGHPNEYCPEDYRCEDFDHDFEPCPGLGKDCARDNYECSPANDVCLERDDGSLSCSCRCQTNADCGRGNQCISIGDGQSACLVPPSAGGCEDDSECADTEFCYNDACVELDEIVSDSPGCTTMAKTPRDGLPWLWLAIGWLLFARIRIRPYRQPISAALEGNKAAPTL